MKKQNPTVFNVVIQSNDSSFLFSPLSMREMDIFSQREKDTKEKGDMIAVRDLYRELIAKCMSKAGDPTTVEDLAELDLPTFNALFSEIMKAHGITLKADTSVGEAKASAGS
jgi:hypothetical protein